MTMPKEVFDGEGPVRVLVELQARPPRDEDLKHLEDLGLEVEKVIRNTVVGVIPREKVSTLEADPAVAAVERSTKLKLHER